MSGLGQTFSLDRDSRGYPIVALSFQRVNDVGVGIIHGNQRDRNMHGEIWGQIDLRTEKLTVSIYSPDIGVRFTFL